MKDLALALREQFGRETEITPLIAEDRMGRRIHGVDLTKELSATQAELMVSLLDHFKIITFPGQNQASFRVGDLERLANHFGAPIHQKTTPTTLSLKRSECRCDCCREMSKPLPGVIRLFPRPFSAGLVQIALRCTW